MSVVTQHHEFLGESNTSDYQHELCSRDAENDVMSSFPSANFNIDSSNNLDNAQPGPFGVSTRTIELSIDIAEAKDEFETFLKQHSMKDV